MTTAGTAKAIPVEYEETNVFLNVPYDAGYEPLFVTLVAATVCLGLRPRAVLEITETGAGRLSRIQDQLETCRISIHDLSRMGPPPRFNMPFELGLACNLARHRPDLRHEILVLERQPYRLDRTLSDYKGRDPLVHEGRCDQLVTCVLDAFVTDGDVVDPRAARRVAKLLRIAARSIKTDYQATTIFRRAAYTALLDSALTLAVSEGVLPE